MVQTLPHLSGQLDVVIGSLGGIPQFVPDSLSDPTAAKGLEGRRAPELGSWFVIGTSHLWKKAKASEQDKWALNFV